jgi:CubicO group peptidase (beta-lactamase class C family)
VVAGTSFNAQFGALLSGPCALAPLSFAASPDNRLGSDTNPRVAGGAASDVRGYSRLLGLHLDEGLCRGQRVLQPATLVAMRANETQGLPKQGSPYSDGRDYGFGWWLEPHANGAPQLYSDAGAFGAKPWIDPVAGYGAFLLIQRNTATGERLYDEIAPLVAVAMSTP